MFTWPFEIKIPQVSAWICLHGVDSFGASRVWGHSFQLNKRLLYETTVNLSRLLPDLFDMSEWHSNTPGKSSGNVTTKDLDT